MKDYEKLKALLDEQERFPLQFTFKFIGRNTPAFAASVARLETLFPELRHENTRESSGGKHSARTYAYDAPDVESIIEIYRSIEGLDDLMVVL